MNLLKIIFLIMLILFIAVAILFNCNNLYNLHYKEPLANYEFEPTQNIKHHLSEIFKHGDLNFNAYPNVQISPGQNLFQDNKFLPECCFYNSQYSTDRGCPCITPDQNYYLQRRGTNKHSSSFIQEKNDYKNLFFSPTMALKGEKVPFKKNNIQFKRDEPPLSDASENYVRLHLLEQER